MSVDYDKLLKDMKNTKFGIINQKKEDENTCNYSEQEGCSLCTHPRWCILDTERWELTKKINYCKYKLNELKVLLSDGLRLIKQYPDKKPSELIKGFETNNVRFEIKEWESRLRVLRKKEFEIKKQRRSN